MSDKTTKGFDMQEKLIKIASGVYKINIDGVDVHFIKEVRKTYRNGYSEWNGISTVNIWCAYINYSSPKVKPIADACLTRKEAIRQAKQKITAIFKS